MAVSNDYVQDILARWTENLWARAEAGKKGGKTATACTNELRAHMSTLATQSEPTGLKRASERGLVMACLGLAFGEAVAPKAVDKISSSKAFDAWRNSVHRNRYQQRYKLFEDVLRRVVDRHGVAEAVAQYPRDSHVTPADVADALGRIGFKPVQFAAGEVEAMIRRVAKTPLAPKKSGPAA